MRTHQFCLMDVTFFKMNKVSHHVALSETASISDIMTMDEVTL